MSSIVVVVVVGWSMTRFLFYFFFGSIGFWFFYPTEKKIHIKMPYDFGKWKKRINDFSTSEYRLIMERNRQNQFPTKTTFTCLFTWMMKNWWMNNTYRTNITQLIQWKKVENFSGNGNYSYIPHTRTNTNIIFNKKRIKLTIVNDRWNIQVFYTKFRLKIE